MNTEAIVHPKLLHYGLTTANMDAMSDWYRKVLGMTVNHRSKIPAIARLTRQGPPFSGFSFITNDERDHRIVFFEIPGASVDPEKRRHTGLQHVAFEYAGLESAGHLYPAQGAEHPAHVVCRPRGGDCILLRGSGSERCRAQHQQLRRSLDGDGDAEDRCFCVAGPGRSREDGCGARGGRFALGDSQARSRRGIRSGGAVQSRHSFLRPC